MPAVLLSRDTVLALPSFAKINLSLRVLGRRADGYHEIRTVFQTITLADRLTLRALDDARLELECGAPDVPADDSNLVIRAAKLLRERFHVARGASIRLEKSIPAGGGLGGGSSNAAVTLAALARLWHVETTRDELSELGATLGADVPFFFAGGTALGAGRGTEIAPLADAPGASLLVVAPRVKISTAEAYKSLNAPALTKEIAPANLLVSGAEADFSDSLPAALANDFEPVICRLHPEVGRARDALIAAGAKGALLSGSGSSVFGVFENPGEVARARARIRVEVGWRVFSCATLARGDYRAAFGECARYLS
ncbi:MAG TPA: 4-(cytidine 5'-diphospho)-2-C-methyl-D-erythritol kinase [Pyrinomonadaceae bacterium]|nr:4-(cytidine 5'-diphospho)-2-C-methyl-D-erythritol kinase [Pyrinomonadaceae bacterium]